MAGNANSGRKIDKVWGDALRLAVNRTDGEKTELAKIAETTVNEAKNGNIQAIKEIGDRLDGKPAQAVQHTGVDDGPIETKWSVEFVNATPESK